MKKNKSVLLGLAIAAILFSACSKDDDPTFAQRVQKNWNFEKLAYEEYYAGSYDYDTTYGSAGDYVDFRTDNKLYTKTTYPGLGVSYDTSNYLIYGESQIISWYDSDPLAKDTLNIEVLTDNQFILHMRDNSSLPDYEDFRLFLNR
jgi:hypothetical protein